MSPRRPMRKTRKLKGVDRVVELEEKRMSFNNVTLERGSHDQRRRDQSRAGPSIVICIDGASLW